MEEWVDWRFEDPGVASCSVGISGREMVPILDEAARERVDAEEAWRRIWEAAGLEAGLE
jgi:hypothetical protein